MELNEEKQLARITEEFTKGVAFFKKREYQKALEVFNRSVQEFNDSQYYSIIEVYGRSKLYLKLCEARLNPVKAELHEDEDYLFNGIFHLNAGNLDMALERFNYLEKKKYNDPYLFYLLSLVHMNKGERETCYGYLRKAIDGNEDFKIIAYNEPDFEPLFDTHPFSTLVKMEAKHG